MVNTNGAAIDPVFSEPDGRFSFHGVPAGTYVIQASIDGEVFQRNELPDGTSLGLRFAEAPGDLEADFPIPARPAIRGVVRDEFGDPANKVIVSALRYWWNDGRLNRGQFARTISDDLGQYRFTNLKPGLYTICAQTNPSDSPGGADEEIPAPEPSPLADFGSPAPIRYYRMSCSVAAGEPPLALDWAQNAEVNLKLESGPRLTVSGRITSGEQAGVSLVSGESDGGAANTQVRPDGSFNLAAPAPGRYNLSIVGFGPEAGLFAAQTVVIGKEPVTGVGLKLQPPARIAVSIRAPSSVLPESITLMLRADGASETFVAARNQQGAYEIRVDQPGRYWVQTRTAEPWCIESILLNGAPVLHGSVDVRAAESSLMDVTLSTECGSIEGRVLIGDPNRFPVVHMLMSGTPADPGDLYKSLTEDGSTIKVTLLPPGRYLIWAWPQDLRYPGPASLADIAGQATVVDLAKGQHASVQLRLVDPRREVK